MNTLRNVRYNMMKNKKTYLVILIAGLLMLSVALTGCTEDDNDENDNDDDETPPDDNDDDDNGNDKYVGTGTEVFSGTWEGEDALGQEEYEGTWEFTVDWDEEDVSGWFDGDAQGDVDGSVAAGEITAGGQAALGYVTWEGTFSPDGSSVSGDWEIEADGIIAYSGEWSGSVE